MPNEIRIYVVARNCACDSKDVLNACDSLGIKLATRSVLARIQIEDARRITDHLTARRLTPNAGRMKTVLHAAPSSEPAPSAGEPPEGRIPAESAPALHIEPNNAFKSMSGLELPTIHVGSMPFQPVQPPTGMDCIQWLVMVGIAAGLDVMLIRSAAEINPEFALFKLRKEAERFCRTIALNLGIVDRHLPAVELIDKIGETWSLGSQMAKYLVQLQRICNRVVHPGRPGQQVVATMQNVQLCAGNLAHVVEAYFKVYRTPDESAA